MPTIIEWDNTCAKREKDAGMSRGRIMKRDKNRVCPVRLAGSLDGRIRKWLQNPQKILAPYVREGMKVLDIGCGPGLFSVELAKMVGKSGKVFSADLQEGMLRKLRNKIHGTELEQRIQLIKSEQDKVGVPGKVDFILAFYMVHEVPNKGRFFEALKNVLKEKGQLLVVEPRLFHVSRKEFGITIETAEKAGFTAAEGPKLRFSFSAILRNV
jgi:ubiquinone/menaquinone biosynthesis C-methylase UbiE